MFDGGEALIQELEVAAGRNVVVCFISDRDGDPPHVMEGMIDMIEVN